MSNSFSLNNSRISEWLIDWLIDWALQLLGITLMVAGIVLKLNQSNDVLPALSILQENATTLEQIMSNISLLAIVIGVLVACVSGFGLFGALCEVRCILITVSTCFSCLTLDICACIHATFMFLFVQKHSKSKWRSRCAFQL